MIDKVKILNSHYSGLEEKFPEGLELDTNSGINIILGPNGIGKTAFLRMLATSIDFQNYFRETGISYFWNYSTNNQASVKQAIEKLNKTKKDESGWYKIDFLNWEGIIKLCQNRGISGEEYFKKDFVTRDIKTGERSRGIIAVNEKGKKLILDFEERLKEHTDENIFGFVKIYNTKNGELYFQNFDLPQDDTVHHIQEIRVDRYCHFINADNFHCRGESPGKNIYSKIEKFLENGIYQFFEEHKNPIWQTRDCSLKGQMKESLVRVSGNMKQPTQKVPENSQLCIVMDEPSVFLDAVNKFRFQNKMVELTREYLGRLQFFIASNDYALIKGLEGTCVYINMYEQPVISSKLFDVHKYLSSPGANCT